MKEFDIYIATIRFTDNKNLSKNRPVVIFATKEDVTTLEILRITSQKHDNVPQYKIKDLYSSGLKKESYVDLSSLYIIDKKDIVQKEKIGELSKEDIGGIIDACLFNNTLRNTTMNDSLKIANRVAQN